RAFSRMTIILLPLLAAGIHHCFLLLQRQAEAGRRIEPRYIIGVFGTMLVVQAFFMGFGEALTGEYGLHVKPRLPPQATELDFVMYTVLTLGVVLIVNDAHWRKFKRGGLVAFGLLLLIATLDVGNQGRFLWTRPVAQVIGPGSGGLMARAYERAKHEGNLYPLIENYFELDRYSNEARLTANGLTKVPMPNFYFERYVNFYQKLQKTPHVMQGLMGKQKLYFHTRAHDDPEAFLRDVNASRNSVHAVRIVSFDGDNLELRVVVDEPGYLTWLDNWDAGWTAELNGQPSDVLISLGTFKTIGLPRAGEHSVRFSYSVPTSTSAHVAFLLGILMLIGYGIGSSRQWRSRRRAVG